LATATSALSSATIVNGDFSAGFTGWSTDGFVSADSSAYLTAGGSYNAVDLLGTTYLDLGVYGDVWGGSAIAQTFDLGSAGSVAFDFLFTANDEFPYNDFAVVSIDGNLTKLSDVATVGDYGISGWQHVSINFGAGSHTVGFGVFNVKDNESDLSSTLEVDNVQAVPEPMSMIALAAGAGVLLRRRRK